MAIESNQTFNDQLMCLAINKLCTQKSLIFEFGENLHFPLVSELWIHNQKPLSM